jgi:signal transduction histidine kinase
LAFDRLFGTLLRGLAVFLSGALTVFACLQGYFASAIISALFGLFVLASQVWSMNAVRSYSDEIRPVEQADTELAILSVILDEAPMAMLVFAGIQVGRPLNRKARLMFADPVDLENFIVLARKHPARVAWLDACYRIDLIEVLADDASQIIWILVDTGSEERRAQARVTRDLLQVLSHEVMNAVAPITSLAQTVEAALAELPVDLLDVKELVGTLGRRAEALQTFTLAYRELARLREPTLAQVKIAAVFGDLERAFVAKWRGQVRFDLGETGFRAVSADAQQLFQALWALVQNAAEAALASDRAPWVRMELQPGQNPTIRISDNGIGIADTNRWRIFHNFFTTKPEGTGVGLGVAQQIARAHGGDVRLVTTGANGSVFELFFLSQDIGRAIGSS